MEIDNTADDGWSEQVFGVLKNQDIRLVATVPDGGLTQLLQTCESDNEFRVVTLSTEEEGIALLSGAWLGGRRGAMLMQSSGVGNCVNMLSLPQICRIPCLMLITMRGEWGEFNPWQVPMGRGTPKVLETMGVAVHRPVTAADIAVTFASAAHHVFNTGNSAAVLVSQRIIGAKSFAK